MTVTAGQKTILRSEKQYSEVRLGLLVPKIVFTCQINQVFTTSDMVAEFSYDTPTGVYGDVLPGQTCYIGTTPGARDVGICRVRKALTADKVYIGEVSDIAFADNLHVTVVDAMEIHAKPLKVISGSEIYVDFDIQYIDQHEVWSPIVRMGSNAVLDVSSYPASISFPVVADSSVFGSTITSYLLTATDGVVSGGTTSNPTLTVNAYPTGGYIRVAETVTASNGKSSTGYRYILVYDDTHRPIEDFTLEDCAGDRQSGMWSGRVKLHNTADISMLREGGLVIIFSRDYFNGTYQPLGEFAGRENILLVGWVHEYTSIHDPEYQPGLFDVQSAGYWMERIYSFIYGVEFNSGISSGWTNIQLLTVDKGLFHFLKYRSTVCEIMDVYLTGDGKYSPACESAADSLWGQIAEVAKSQVNASPITSYNGSLFIQTEWGYIPESARLTYAKEIMALEANDFSKTTKIRRQRPTTSQVVLSGVSVDSAGNGSPIFSLAPGHVPTREGKPKIISNMLLSSQSQANELAGLSMAVENNPYKSIPVKMIGNNRFFDIAPVQYGTITTDEYTGYIIPESIEITVEKGKIKVEIEFSAGNITPVLNVNGDIPDEGGTIDLGAMGKLPPIPPISPTVPISSFPAVIPNPVTTPCGSTTKMNFFNLSWNKAWLIGSDPTKLIAKASLNCYIRAPGFTQTYIDLKAFWYSDAISNYAVYGCIGGARVVTGSIVKQSTNSARIAFAPASNTLIDSIEVELTAGIGAGGLICTPGAVINTGSVAGTNSAGHNINVTTDRYFCVEGTGGPWLFRAEAEPTRYFYNFWRNPGGDPVWGIGQNGWDYIQHLEIPSGCIYTEAVGSKYGRTYFHGNDVGGVFNFCVSDFLFADNGGSLGWILREAEVTGRQINLMPSVINNVCI